MAIARYFKANYKVVEYLKLKGHRLHLADGNYILWLRDLQSFGSLLNTAPICAQIGALALTAREARQEQDGKVLRELPTATDERFYIAPATEDEETAEEEETMEEAVEETTTETEQTEDTAEETTEEVATTTEEVDTSTETVDTSTETVDTSTEETTDTTNEQEEEA